MKSSFELKAIFELYRNRKLTSQNFLDAMKGEKHGLYYIYSFLQLKDTSLEDRQKAFELLLESQDATCLFDDFIINCNPTNEERNLAFKKMFNDYYTIAKFISQEHATIDEIKYTIQNLNVKNSKYNDVVNSLKRYFTVTLAPKDYSIERKSIIPFFNSNPLLLFNLIEKVWFLDDEKTLIYRCCSLSLFSLVQKSRRIYTYCHHFKHLVNYEEKTCLVQKIINELNVEMATEILKFKIIYRLEQDLEDRLDSLLVMDKISS